MQLKGKSVTRVGIVGAGVGGLTAELSPGEIAAPIRWILRSHSNVQVLLQEVLDFNLEQKKVITKELVLDYDFLIIASGATHAYFGHEEWEPLAPGLKTIEDALEIRRRVLLAFELAERQKAHQNEHQNDHQNDHPNKTAGQSAPPLQFAVIGGGPTGVELAGTLAEISRHALNREFRNIDPQQTRILLIEGGPRVLPAYSEELSRKAEDQLRRLGVEVRTSHMVNRIEPGTVWVGDEKIAASVILWAAGVAASPLGQKLGVAIDRAGRVLVHSDLSIPGHPEVFVIGDLAALNDENGKMLPGVAPVAIQQGDWVADTIARDLQNQPRQNFRYHDKGSLATIGRAAAVAQFGKSGKFHLSGYFAWLAWLFIHILFLIGFRNRLMVMIQWAWSYLTYERGARLITGSDELPGWTHSQENGGATGVSPVHPGADARLSTSTPVAAVVTATQPRH